MDFDEISWSGRAWPRDQWVQFFWRSRSLSGSRSPKSEIRIQWIIELPTDFDEILWKAGMWPRDQVITFWWRSASLSVSGRSVPTIRIREELPQFYYAGVRRRSVLSEYFWFCLSNCYSSMGQIIKSATPLCLFVCLSPLLRSQFSFSFDKTLHCSLEPRK